MTLGLFAFLARILAYRTSEQCTLYWGGEMHILSCALPRPILRPRLQSALGRQAHHREVCAAGIVGRYSGQCRPGLVGYAIDCGALPRFLLLTMRPHRGAELAPMFANCAQRSPKGSSRSVASHSPRFDGPTYATSSAALHTKTRLFAGVHAAVHVGNGSLDPGRRQWRVPLPCGGRIDPGGSRRGAAPAVRLDTWADVDAQPVGALSPGGRPCTFTARLAL